MGDKEENKSDISENLRKEFEKTGKIHIEKDQDGEKVVIDVDKDSKTVREQRQSTPPGYFWRVPFPARNWSAPRTR